MRGSDQEEAREHSQESKEEIQWDRQLLLRGLTVLIIEDSMDAMMLFAKMLARSGAKVVNALSASQAWNVFTHTTPDVIVSDIAMADEDGISFIKRVRQEGGPELAHIPAIALTAFTEPVVRNFALKSGFQEFLSKPVSQAELVNSILKVTRPGGNHLH